MRDPFILSELLGPKGHNVTSAMDAGLRFLESHAATDLLSRLGNQVQEIAPFDPVDKSVLQDSYGGNQTGPSDDLLVGRGLFYLTEQRRLFLDCTSGHYQMTWGYSHPALCRIVEEGTRAGIVWDNHSNIPQSPLKQLGHRLVEVANDPGETDPIDTVLLGVCTGSVACAAALKIQLKVYEKRHGRTKSPVVVVLDGNYHGTDMIPQFLRGLWPDLVQGLEVIALQPNDADALENVFRKEGSRIAGFWAEPVMMNREAIAVKAEYLQLARRWCDQVGALMCIDEIQTGFWQPEIFAFRALGVQPDLVVAGKGMTAGFHPLSAVLYKQRYDVLAQYDAISTNGSAALPALVALGCMELIRQHEGQIQAISRRIQHSFERLAAEFPERLESAQGRGYLSGLKFKRVQDAIDFHRRTVEAGLWTRVHAYHEGHSTLLTKLGLLVDETVVDFLLGRFRSLLREP
jgi:acetylornithine/N-succinyldiaminopimelate aminotransferase